MTAPAPYARSLDALQASFLAIVPRIERHGRVSFRGLGDADGLDEALAEMVALSWRWFLRLAQRGKDPTRFPSAIAGFAARAVRSGRRVWGQESGGDVLSPLAQRRHGFAVGKLPDRETLSDNPLCDALADNTVTPVDEQVAFRMDFPAWLASQSDRDRRIALDLMASERTSEVAGRHGLSAGRVSQMRRQFRDGWRRFQDGPPEASGVGRAAVA